MVIDRILALKELGPGERSNYKVFVFTIIERRFTFYTTLQVVKNALHLDSLADSLIK